MLDLFFRKYAWTANLALLFAAAWLSAKTVNTLVGALVRPRPQVDVSALPTAAPRPALPVAIDDAKLYHLIGVEPPKPTEPDDGPAVAQRPQNCQDPRATPVRTTLGLQLVATLIGERKRDSLATLLETSTQQRRVVGVGEVIGGAEVLGVERVRTEDDSQRDMTGNGFRVVAIVCNGGTKEYVDFENAGGETTTLASAGGLGNFPVPPPGPRPSGPANPLEGVRQVSPGKYEVDKSVIDQALGNMSVLATQARIVPAFKDGKPNGFKLFSIQPGSLYASLGIENGDVIQRINGYEINSPEKALELYQKLRESSHVSIDSERNQAIVKKDITITGGGQQ
jgi:general secretion pathway protein C